MPEKILELDPFGRISLKTLRQKVLTEIGYPARVRNDDRCFGSDLYQKFVQRFRFVGSFPEQTLIQNDAHRPEKGMKFFFQAS